MKNLLESKKGHLIINEMDGEGEIGYNSNVFYHSLVSGMTPLHISSQNGHTRVVRLLLTKGALLHR